MFAWCSLSSSPLCLPCVGAAARGTNPAWPEVPRSPHTDIFLWSPLVFGQGWQDLWEQKQLEGGAFIAACTPSPFCTPLLSAMLRGCMITWHSQGCSEQPLPCALAGWVLSLECHCQHAHSGGVPCLAGRRARKVFPVLEGKLHWTFSLWARLLSSSSGPAPLPPLPFQVHK